MTDVIGTDINGFNWYTLINFSNISSDGNTGNVFYFVSGQYTTVNPPKISHLYGNIYVTTISYVSKYFPWNYTYQISTYNYFLCMTDLNVWRYISSTIVWTSYTTPSNYTPFPDFYTTSWCIGLKKNY